MSQSTTNLQSYSSAQTSWQRRWFCTYSSYLLYYASPSSPKILAALDLSVVGEICRFRNDPTGKTFVILVGEVRSAASVFVEPVRSKATK